MNMQEIKHRFQNINQDMKLVWKKFRSELATKKPEENHLMTEEEKLDEAIDESFPASDPPGHFSKSLEDRELH